MAPTMALTMAPGAAPALGSVHGATLARARWVISPLAAAEAGLEVDADRCRAVVLEIEIVECGGEESGRRPVVARAWLEVDGRRRELAIEGDADGGGEGALVRDGAWSHADVAGVVSVSWRDDGVAYARTALLSRLGIGGGRYERLA